MQWAHDLVSSLWRHICGLNHVPYWVCGMSRRPVWWCTLHLAMQQALLLMPSCITATSLSYLCNLQLRLMSHSVCFLPCCACCCHACSQAVMHASLRLDRLSFKLCYFLQCRFVVLLTHTVQRRITARSVCQSAARKLHCNLMHISTSMYLHPFGNTPVVSVSCVYCHAE